MGLAIAAVKEGDAQAAVSGGNTGALMAMAKLALRTMPGIDRPALAALLPTLGDNDLVMLDLGANTECDASNLVQFAVMGAAYARVVLELERPRVQLLNIGTEELKGTDELQGRRRDPARRRASAACASTASSRATSLSRGDVDVVVTDGFSGNIALKSLEGTARFVTDLLRRAFTSSLRSKIGFLISRPATELLRHHLDPNNHNGAVFLGLNGLVVKSHGSATDKGVANAIRVAARMVREDIYPQDHRGSRQRLGARRRKRRAANMSRRSRDRRHRIGAAARARVTNAELAETGRHHRRMDRRAHRHRGAPYRRRRRDHRDARHRGGAQGARRGRRSTRSRSA